jgi:hypothetical protein
MTYPVSDYVEPLTLEGFEIEAVHAVKEVEHACIVALRR